MEHRDGEKVIKLLIVADDFTGALDTGVQFATNGAVTRVVTDVNYDYKKAEAGLQVLVMNAETRHLSGQDAYDVVYHISKKAFEQGIPYIYKKTDSALRGNIGSELSAVLDASGEMLLPFLPAFPKMKRITRHGIHFIDGVPARESVFGEDPFEPVKHSYIPDVIHNQSTVSVRVIESGVTQKQVLEKECTPTIEVYDTEDETQMLEIARRLLDQKRLRIMAGCAGFASMIPKLLQLEGEKSNMPQFFPRLLVICGSVNPITKKQLNYAEHHGFKRIRLTLQQKLSKQYWESSQGREELERLHKYCSTEQFCILDANDPEHTKETLKYAKENAISTETLRVSIAGTVGFLQKELINKGIKSTLLITGGDTLLGFMNQIGLQEMEPICELEPGIVLSQVKIKDTLYQIISKSGGFGEEKLLVKLADRILGK